MATPKAKKPAARRRGLRRQVQVEYYGDDFKMIVEKYKDRALFAAGKIVLADASRRAPRRSGKLAGSGYISTATQSTFIKKRYWRNEKRPPADAVTIGFAAPHAHLVESGRKKARKFYPRKATQRRTAKKALRFGGRYLAWSRVKRLSGRHFLATALEATKDRIMWALASQFGDALQREMPE